MDEIVRDQAEKTLELEIEVLEERVPEEIKGGEIVFRDPRGPAVAMYETPDIDLPWVGNGIGIPFSPATGHLLIFPAWLEHRVERFEGTGERISIAFNASNP